MWRYRIITLLAVAIFFMESAVYSPASAKEITVDDDSEADFISIQQAVDSSSPGDTVIVRPGTYRENILINVTWLTVRSESGNPDALVKPIDENKSIFFVKADNVTISGFNITEAGESFFSSSDTYYPVCGIYLENSSNCIITGNTLFENGGEGISLYNASYNTVSENLLFNDSIFLGEGSVKNTLTENTIEKGWISLGAWSSSNLITENKISNGTGEFTGVSFGCCGAGDVVSCNTIFNCSTGIDAYDRSIHIRNNTITNCFHGIELTSSIGTGIYNNTISNCSIGINLGSVCPGIWILNNTITSSIECGISIPDYEGRERIYNNYFNNNLNIRLGIGEGNSWNNSLTLGTNIVEGSYLGGNFWGKPDGTGFSQNCVDLNKDGICDYPYKVNDSEFDYLPLCSISLGDEKHQVIDSGCSINQN